MKGSVPVDTHTAFQATSDFFDPSAYTGLLPSASAFRDAPITSALSTRKYGLAGNRVLRCPRALRLHPVFDQLNLAVWLIGTESREMLEGVRLPILITDRGILLSGFADWRAAGCAEKAQIDCTEFALSDAEALEVILILHRLRSPWNDFIRTELALRQVSYFESKALANQIAGGKHKGFAVLPKAEHIDVRKEVGHLAGVSSRTVSKVKIILKNAHAQVIDALRNGTISINCGLKLCQAERGKQVEELTYFLWQRSKSKTTAEFVDRLRLEKVSANTSNLLSKLQQLEASKPGSIEFRTGTRQKTVIFMGKDHVNHLASLEGL